MSEQRPGATGPKNWTSVEESISQEQQTPVVVVVCADCLRASCFQGVFMCDKSRTANVALKTIDELRQLNLESPDYWKEVSTSTEDQAAERRLSEAREKFLEAYEEWDGNQDNETVLAARDNAWREYIAALEGVRDVK